MAERDLRVLIVDDEEPARKRLRRALLEIPNIIISGEATSGFQAVEVLSQGEIDLVFLDIQMPGLNGFEVLAKLENTPLVIFVTAYDEHAVRAFEVGSLDYLLKPYPLDRVEKAVARARKHFGEPPPDWGALLQTLAGEKKAPLPIRVAVRCGENTRFLSPKQILYAVSEDRVVRIQTVDERYISDDSLISLGKKLGDKFFRCHRAVLVNLERIKEIEPWFAGSYRIILDVPKTEKLPLSRRRVKAFKDIMPL